MGRHHRQRWMLFNKLPQDDLGTGRWFALHLCGCSSASRARPRHGRGHEFETRHPLQGCACKRSPFARHEPVRRDGLVSERTHFGCVHALRGHATWCWWSGMCAVLGQTTCSETPHPTGCSRLGTAEVDSHALVAQQAEQPPCKRQAARSNRRRGHQTCRVRLDGRGHRAFNPGTRVRIPHATPALETIRLPR